MSDDYTGPYDGHRPNSQPIEKLTRKTSRLDVHSMFYTIQGEGPFAGTPSVFIRLAGCNLQCPLCDTEYSADRESLHHNEIADRVSAMPLHDKGLVVITGGEPFRQPIGLQFLIYRLLEDGFYVQIETNGTLPPPKDIDFSIKPSERKGAYIVCSPKSGKVNPLTAERACCFKYVIDAENVDFTDGLPITALNHTANPRLARPPFDRTGAWTKPVYVQPCDEQDEKRNRANIEAAVESGLLYGYIVQLQTHKYLGLE